MKEIDMSVAHALIFARTKKYDKLMTDASAGATQCSPLFRMGTVSLLHKIISTLDCKALTIRTVDILPI
jgi:hypothetical protein